MKMIGEQLSPLSIYRKIKLLTQSLQGTSVTASSVLYRALTTNQNEDSLDEMQFNLYSKLKKSLGKSDIVTGILTDRNLVALGLLLGLGGMILK